MLRGFFDESHRDSKDKQFIMAGWLASVDEWERISDAWQACLMAHRKINYFKSYEAYNLNGQFLKFSKSERDAKCLALAKVIASHHVRGYIATANHKIIQNKPKRLGKMMGTRIYDWGFMTIISTVLQERSSNLEKQKIDFIFDKATELRSCIESYEEIRQKLPASQKQIAGEAIPGDDKELAGLQAADLFAGEVSYQIKHKKVRPPFSILVNSGNLIYHAPAIPPQGIEGAWKYAHEVYQRKELVSEIIKELKEKGITLDDLKKMVDSDYDANAKSKAAQ